MKTFLFFTSNLKFNHLGLPGAIASTKQFIDGTLLPGRDSSDEKDLTASVTATNILA